MRQRLQIEDRTFQIDVIDRNPLRLQVREGDQLEEILYKQTLNQGQGRLWIDDRYAPYFVTETGKQIWVTFDGVTFVFEKVSGQTSAGQKHGGFEAPMPGKVTQVNVSAGDRVSEGQVLVIMEAMKMEHRIEAPRDGRVTAIHCQADDLVDQGFQLLDFEDLGENDRA